MNEKPELILDVGTPLLVEVAEQGVHYKSAFVGAVSDEYLILKLQTDDLAARYGQGSPAEAFVTVRYVQHGEVYGFGTRILGAISTPSPLLFVEYPEAVRVRDARTSCRYDCMLPASACIGKTCVEAMVIDLSTEGCRCSVRTDDAESVSGLDGMLGLNTDASVRLPVTGRKGEIELTGIVRNVSTDSERTVFGICFGEIPGDAKADLEDLLSSVKNF